MDDRGGLAKAKSDSLGERFSWKGYQISTMLAWTANKGATKTKLLVMAVALVLLLAGCGGAEEEFTAPTEKTEIVEETTTEARSTQAPPRSKEEAAADEAKKRAVANKERPTFEVANVRPGTITSTDLSAGNADVFLTDLGGRPYGIMKQDPVLQEIADEIRADNPEYEMMLVSVYSGTEKREDRFMSNWYAFESPAVEREFLADFENYADELVQEFKDKQSKQNAKVG